MSAFTKREQRQAEAFPREGKPTGDRRPKGEIWVWVTGATLLLGLALVLGLLALITKNGLAVFWPKPVALVEMSDPAQGIANANVFAGEQTMYREKASKQLDEEGNELPPESEYQFFVGNKDAYGFSFKFVNADAVERLRYPESLMLAERMEYGDAIFEPLRLVLADGSEIPQDEPAFDVELRRLVREAAERREAIRQIERGEIGEISRQLEDLRLQEKAIEQGGSSRLSMEEIEAERAALQAQYQEKADAAQVLRRQQREAALVGVLPTGGERRYLIGDIVSYYYPNQLSFLDKVGHFFVGMWKFVSEEPREANTEGGIFPAIFGTFVMTILMSALVTPVGVVAAVYLREYAKQGPLVRGVRIAINNLAGVPSIVFGVFGLGFFVYLVGGSIDQLFFELRLPSPTFGTGGLLWASLTLALMTVPVVIVATEEALAAVSRGVREGSMACGASKWQTIQRLILPASLPGILTGLILAMARGAGEVAPLMLVGVVKLAPSLPIDGDAPFVHLDRKFMHLGFHIYDLGFQSPDSEAAKPMVFATTLFLIALVVTLNIAAILLRNHIRKKYISNVF